ncbi:uncharacterized protein LOC141660872 [Apium graveolens]|uniref:uncharacterized protein LOC141660872 n=1 Tax=Apium graveolens TaxID=4045 RepID=UPI003D7AAD36
MATSRVSITDLQSPLFLHPSDGPLSISVTKLQGAADYRTWRRTFEIQLSAKRKYGFLDGSVIRNATDAIEASQWDTCNNMVISWIHNNISDSIKSSVLFINNASDIWKQLETRFSLTNGSRKYKLNRDLFNMKQNGMKVSEYFTSLSSLWEEIDSMNILTTVAVITTDINKLLSAIEVMKQESRLFQFLNGLDEIYGAQRSQLLMMAPLPTVEVACAAVLQEESQKEVLSHMGIGDNDVVAMYSKGGKDKVPVCSSCGRKGHQIEKCWEVTGNYPRWHSKYKPNQRSNTGKWSGNKWESSRMANNVQQSITVTSQQLEQLLKLIPQDASNQQGYETDEEINIGFSGMAYKNDVKKLENDGWIIDSGASDHMTSSQKNLINVKRAPTSYTITLPTGATTLITHIGNVVLQNGLKLNNVLYVPQFNHNLLSIHKLAQDGKCEVTFQPNRCVITDVGTKHVVGVGEIKQGMYYLKNENFINKGVAMNGIMRSEKEIIDSNGRKEVGNQYAIWHHRLGHAVFLN